MAAFVNLEIIFSFAGLPRCQELPPLRIVATELGPTSPDNLPSPSKITPTLPVEVPSLMVWLATPFTRASVRVLIVSHMAGEAQDAVLSQKAQAQQLPDIRCQDKDHSPPGPLFPSPP